MSERRYSDGYRKLRRADEPRRIAYEVLYEVQAKGAFANILLPKALRQARREGHFSDRDAAFTSELVHGTLRAIGRLDWVIARHVDRPLADLDPRVLVLARMGAHQLLDMRVPDHAAVSATVDVAREHLTDGPVRFVNAVLRSITREDPSEREAAMDAIADEDEALGVRYSHPAWMVAAFREALKAHGYPTDELLDVLEADNEVPTVTLVARPSLMSVDELADEAGEFVDRAIDGFGGGAFRGRVIAGRIDDVVVDVHGGGALELRAHRLDGVARELLIGERTPVDAFEDCAARIDPRRRLSVGLDAHLVVFTSHTEGQLSMREQRGHAKGGDRRQHRVPGVHGDRAASKGAQMVGELDACLISESVGDDDDGAPVGTCDEETVERIDAPAGRRNGDVPCAHAAQGIIPRAREGAQVVIAVRVFDVSVEVGEDVVDVNGSGGAHVVSILLINGPQAAIRVRVAGEALGCVREGDAWERTQVGEQTCPRTGGIP